MKIGKYLILTDEEWKQARAKVYESGKEVGDGQGYARGKAEADPWSSVGEIVKLCADDPLRTRCAMLKSMESGTSRINYSLFLEECRRLEPLSGAEVEAQIDVILGRTK